MLASKPWKPIKFDTQHWLTDQNIRQLSSAARGFLVDLLCTSSELAERGKLKLNGQAATVEQLTRLTCCGSLEVAQSCLDELLKYGVLSREEDGTFVCIKMHAKTHFQVYRCNVRVDIKTAEWKTARLAVFERDLHKCGYCGMKAVAVDHIFPFSRGGKLELENLVAVCKKCNSKKHNKTPEEAGMPIRWWAGREVLSYGK